MVERTRESAYTEEVERDVTRCDICEGEIEEGEENKLSFDPEFIVENPSKREASIAPGDSHTIKIGRWTVISSNAGKSYDICDGCREHLTDSRTAAEQEEDAIDRKLRESDIEVNDENVDRQVKEMEAEVE